MPVPATAFSMAARAAESWRSFSASLAPTLRASSAYSSGCRYANERSSSSLLRWPLSQTVRHVAGTAKARARAQSNQPCFSVHAT